MDLFRCHGSILIYIFLGLVLFYFSLSRFVLISLGLVCVVLSSFRIC